MPALEAAVYRITQEAIANTIKHAQATRLIVTVVENGDVLSLSVEDDGCGFDQNDQTGAGFGLIGLRERVELLGGTLAITSHPGAGTRVDAVVPVERRSTEASGSSAPERDAG